MSTIFQYPFRPLDWAATPKDFTTVGGNHQLQLGPYTIETTQRFIHGTRFLMWDGRVMKYALAEAELESYHGCCATEAAALSALAAPTAANVGDRMVQITLSGRSEDDLVGGYIQLYDGTDIDTTTQRGIVGNTTSATTVDVYLDYPLHQPIVATTDFMEVYENPYGAVSEVSNEYAAWVGVPNVSCDAAYNVWIQTWGPCCISPGNLTLDDPIANERSVVWAGNAVIVEQPTTSIQQYAGYILNSGSSAIAGPIIMLMCST